MSKSTFWILFSFVILFSSIFLFARLGQTPFIDYDEASYATIIDSTAKSPDISVPLMGQSPSFEKPPLYYWLSMASGHVFDGKELAYRAPAALFGILGIALVMLIVLELSGSYGAALFAGMILLTSGLYIEAARQLRLDVPVSVCLLISLFCYLKVRKDPRWYIGIGVGLGLGVMFKNVIGLAVIPILLVWSMCNMDWRWLKNRYVWIGATIAAVIVVPWHWHESSLFGWAFWNQYIGFNVFTRFGSNIMSNSLSTVEYAKLFFWSLLPWSTVLLLALVNSAYRIIKKVERFRDDPAIPASLISLLIIAFFLSSSTKLEYYFVPAAPFIAIAVGMFVWQIMKMPGVRSWAVILACSILLVGGFYTMRQIGYDKEPILSGWVSLAKEESAAGSIIANEPDSKFYVYNYPFRETVRYYSGNKDILTLAPGVQLHEPILLLVQASYYDSKPFPPDLQARMTVKFRGHFPLLVRID